MRCTSGTDRVQYKTSSSANATISNSFEPDAFSLLSSVSILCSGSSFLFQPGDHDGSLARSTLAGSRSGHPDTGSSNPSDRGSLRRGGTSSWGSTSDLSDHPAAKRGLEQPIHLEAVFSPPCTARRGNRQLHLEAVLQLTTLEEMRTGGLGLAAGPITVQLGQVASGAASPSGRFGASAAHGQEHDGWPS